MLDLLAFHVAATVFLALLLGVVVLAQAAARAGRDTLARVRASQQVALAPGERRPLTMPTTGPSAAA